jgi:flagellar protein FliS
MFAPAALSHTASNVFAGTYRLVGVETGVPAASPHRLVTMLFDGFNDAVAQARNALRQGDVQAKCMAITRAVRIVDEGLKASLDVDSGGPLASDLLALYGYVTVRLTEANLHNDGNALAECAALLEPVRSAWIAIDPAGGTVGEVQ